MCVSALVFKLTYPQFILTDVMGQVWFLIVSIPDPCCLSYFKITTLNLDGSFMSQKRRQND